MRQGAHARDPPAVGARNPGREGYRGAELAVRLRSVGFAIQLRISRDEVTVIVGASDRRSTDLASTGPHLRGDVVGC